MLLSMTGSGEAHAAGPGVTVGVEVRAVNNRHLKVMVRGSEPYPHLEPEVEKVVRRSVRRGSVQVRVQVDRPGGGAEYRLNAGAVRAYWEQWRAAFGGPAEPTAADGQVLAALLSLPGVTDRPNGAGAGPPDDEWPLVEQVLEQALGRLDVARTTEGRVMAQELGHYHQHMADRLALIGDHLPAVMAGYCGRILDRVRQAVADAGVGVGVEPAHLVREVALFADRTDVAEEVSRFAAHLDQFAEVMRLGAEGAGRRLEFITQELGREANTLGSKAGDVTISRHVIELKATLEKVRELIQNIE